MHISLPFSFLEKLCHAHIFAILLLIYCIIYRVMCIDDNHMTKMNVGGNRNSSRVVDNRGFTFGNVLSSCTTAKEELRRTVQFEWQFRHYFSIVLPSSWSCALIHKKTATDNSSIFVLDQQLRTSEVNSNHDEKKTDPDSDSSHPITTHRFSDLSYLENGSNTCDTTSGENATSNDVQKNNVARSMRTTKKHLSQRGTRINDDKCHDNLMVGDVTEEVKQDQEEEEKDQEDSTAWEGERDEEECTMLGDNAMLGDDSRIIAKRKSIELQRNAYLRPRPRHAC